MIQFELLKNDVGVRAESLSYFTLFSILPLLTGVFLILGFFSQWGPVQNEFLILIPKLLDAFPEEHRNTLMAYIIQFKDQYLASVNEKSGKLGVLALGVLIWIGAKVFFNIESLINGIWEVDQNRGLFARIKNFFFCSIFLPLIYAVILSVPRVAEFMGDTGTAKLFDRWILSGTLFLSLLFMYRFFPNTKVSLKSALAGAGFSTAAFIVANGALKIYFKFAIQSAYGKIAVLPLFAFFIYVAWMIFIIGVEVALLVQRGDEMFRMKLPESNLAKAALLERVVEELGSRFEKGEGPSTCAHLAKTLQVNPNELARILAFLVKRGVVVKATNDKKGPTQYVLAKAVQGEELISVIKEYLNLSHLAQRFDVISLISRLK